MISNDRMVFLSDSLPGVEGRADLRTPVLPFNRSLFLNTCTKDSVVTKHIRTNLFQYWNPPDPRWVETAKTLKKRPVKYRTGAITTWADPQTESALQIISGKELFSPEKLQSWFKRLYNLEDFWMNHIDFSNSQRELPRLSAWTPACKCNYFFSGTMCPPTPCPTVLKEIETEVMSHLSLRTLPNCCFLNLYRNGNDRIGYHADDEGLYDSMNQSVCIVSFSLGGERDFQIRMIENQPNQCITFRLKAGDICVMSGNLQKHYHHRIPPEPCNKECRINMTWRWILNHNCKNETSTAVSAFE